MNILERIAAAFARSNAEANGSALHLSSATAEYHGDASTASAPTNGAPQTRVPSDSKAKENKPMTILHLDSSPRGERSHSRQMTRALVDELTRAMPEARTLYRDLGRNAPPLVNEQWIAGAYSDPSTHTDEMKAALSMSNELVGELFAADVIVLGAPMYNLSIPAALKAYIDQVVRAGVTFSYPGYEGLVKGKKMFVLAARGGSGYGSGEQMEAMNFQDPYLKTIFGMIGITDVTFIHDEKTLGGDSELPHSLEVARQAAHQVAAV